jgi:UDP-N-acetylmuramate--alanine ligase
MTSARDRALAESALRRPLSPYSSFPARWLLVDVARQRVVLFHGGEALADYRVSTSKRGIGGADGSYCTPPGWHRIHARIGEGAERGATFEGRVATGRVWRGEAGPGDLILTRILTLDGLEEGVNRGEGRDSLTRYIYFHGTNDEGRMGEPSSHGCVRMLSADIEDLFERVAAGDPVAVIGDYLDVPAVNEPIPDPLGAGRFHYAGVGGSGMSALAQFQVMRGGRASGSDRGFDAGGRPAARAQLEALDIRLLPQDGSGIDDDCAALVVSTAVEPEVPDFAAAVTRGLPIVHRSRLLAHFVGEQRTIAVSGTSGKSTVVAMIFEILHSAERDPSVITGGDLLALQKEGLWGNAWAGRSELLVVEADESDGSLVAYEPSIAVVLNLQKDHKDPGEVLEMLRVFERRTRETLVCGMDAELAPLIEEARSRGVHCARFGVSNASVIHFEAEGSTFEVEGVAFRLPVPGAHNVENALAAIAACRAVGVSLAETVAPLASFQGVGRRFQTIGRANGVEVVDDFAHNPKKIEAAIATARRRARGRVLAVYQPHGYGPTRFLRPDLVESFAGALGENDRLWLLEVFYAGGTAKRDFSSADIVAEIAARGRRAAFAASRDDLTSALTAEARPGDLILIMGARDPSLTELARAILGALEARASLPSQR